MSDKTKVMENQKQNGTSISYYFNEPQLSLPVLERAEQDELFLKMNSSKTDKSKQKIRNKIIDHNLRLVALLSKDYEGLGLERSDLISEGNTGLMIAVDRFDTKKNCKFSHYAGIWIRQRMMRALVNKGRTIRLPYRILSLKLAVTKFIEFFRGNKGKDPSDFEIAKNFKITIKKVKSLSDVQIYSSSLNARVNGVDGNNEEVGNLIADQVNLPVDEVVLAKENINLLNKFLGKLNTRDKDVICKRFGMNINKESTLGEIGSIYGVTKERIRQIEEKALLKLRKMIKNEMKVKLPKKDKSYDFRKFDVIDPLLCKLS